MSTISADESWGNYRSYYRRRRGPEATARSSRPSLPPDRDERLQSLKGAIEWRGARVLDVGCNSGEVAVEIAQRLGAKEVVGVDVDPALVNRCHATLSKAVSLMAADWHRVELLGGDDGSKATLGKRKRSQDAQAGYHYFPSCFPDLFGSIDTRFWDIPFPPVEPPPKRKTKHREAAAKDIAPSDFPRNVRFVKADWVKEDLQDDEEPYDVILA